MPCKNSYTNKYYNALQKLIYKQILSLELNMLALRNFTIGLRNVGLIAFTLIQASAR
jgi:thiosulfate reductase cytochrome b subunit